MTKLWQELPIARKYTVALACNSCSATTLGPKLTRELGLAAQLPGPSQRLKALLLRLSRRWENSSCRSTLAWGLAFNNHIKLWLLRAVVNRLA